MLRISLPLAATAAYAATDNHMAHALFTPEDTVHRLPTKRNTANAASRIPNVARNASTDNPALVGLLTVFCDCALAAGEVGFSCHPHPTYVQRPLTGCWPRSVFPPTCSGGCSPLLVG